MGFFGSGLVNYEKPYSGWSSWEAIYEKIDETYPERSYTGTRNTINTTRWLIWSFYTSLVSDSSRHLVEISGGFGEVGKVHVPKWWGLQQNLDGDLWGFKCLNSICIRIFGDVVRHFIVTISSISQHVCCGTQIEKELQIDGTCGKLRDAYKAGYSVSLKPLWFHKLKKQVQCMNLDRQDVLMFFATCEVVEPVCQVLKYWDSQHQSSWLYTQRLQVYPHHGPLDFGTKKGILRFLFYFFVFFVRVGFTEVIVLKCRWSPCSPNKNKLSQVFGAWWNMKTWRHAGSDMDSSAGTKLGYMKAPKNTTLEKYLNISFPPPIRKQKKSTWSLWIVSVFVWQICLL